MEKLSKQKIVEDQFPVILERIKSGENITQAVNKSGISLTTFHRHILPEQREKIRSARFIHSGTHAINSRFNPNSDKFIVTTPENFTDGVNECIRKFGSFSYFTKENGWTVFNKLTKNEKSGFYYALQITDCNYIAQKRKITASTKIICWA